MRNHSYENDFDLHENEPACRTYFHMKGFALRLVLKLRHKRTRKWPIPRIRKWPIQGTSRLNLVPRALYPSRTLREKALGTSLASPPIPPIHSKTNRYVYCVYPRTLLGMCFGRPFLISSVIEDICCFKR